MNVNTGINVLKAVVNRVMWDGYVNSYEASQINKYALKDDNTVTDTEKTFLRDAYDRGAYMDPAAHHTFKKLMTYGEIKISDQMAELRARKKDERWFNREYLEHAVPALIESTDSLTERMNELHKVKRETRMFNSDFRKIGVEVLRNSADSIAVRLNELNRFKKDAGLFNNDYKELGKEILLASYDTKTARLMALENFRYEAGLFNREYQELKDRIRYDS